MSKGMMGGCGPAQRMGMPKATVKDSRGTILRLLPYWGKHWLALVGICACSLVAAGASVLTPLVIARTIDTCVKVADGANLSGIVGLYGGSASQLMTSVSIDYTLLGLNLLILVGLYVAGMAAQWAQEYGMTCVSQKIINKLRGEMMNHLLTLDVAYYDTNSRGDLLSRFTNDAEMIRDGMGQTIVQLLTTVATMTGMIWCMASMSLTLTGFVCMSIPIVILLSRFVVRRSRKLFREQQDATGRLNAVVEESVGGIRTIRSMGSEERWIETFAKVNEAVRSVGVSAQINSGVLMPILRLLDNLAYILVAVAGGMMAIGSGITVGAIQAFLLYTRRFMRPINMIATQINTLQSAVAGAERIFEMMNARPHIVNAPGALLPQEDVKGRVVFDHVSFGYTEGRDVLHDVSFTAEAGEVVAIVGGTGAGKTTMMNLLGRFYDVGAGRITIDGTDIRQFDITYLRDSMAVVLQDPTLFSDTVSYNIAYGDPAHSSEAEVRESARQALADTFIERLPLAYSTPLVRQGENISHGQRQQLTIARAIHSHAPMLVLDEATSNIDTHTEAMLQSAITNLTHGRTCFIIAHRLSTIRGADKIIVLDKGQIAEMGTHHQLIARGGVYKRLFDSQFGE